MLKLFFTLFAITLTLATLWLITGITAQVSPRSYLDLSAPWWHMTLHAAWFLAGLATSMTGATMLLDWRSRRKKLAGQPPQNA